jgi:hypothetical protein
VLTNVSPVEQLKGIAGRRSKPDEYKSVRNPLVEEEVSHGWAVVKKGRSTTRLNKAKTREGRGVPGVPLVLIGVAP